MAKPDIKAEVCLDWNEYLDKPIDQALPSIYTKACTMSAQFTTWYWSSIRGKRRMSLGTRALTFLLLVAGTLIPVVTGLYDKPEQQLLFTQLAICSLALAGLLQVADKVFGWSSGWLRYIATVTAMENQSRKFEVDWAGYILSKNGAVTVADVKPLFDIAVLFQDSILKLLNDETEKWAAEFNSGTAILADLIKSQRESSEKATEAANAALAAQKTIADTKAKANLTGAVEVSIVHNANPVPVSISIDNQSTESFLGTSWSRLNVAPGQHTITIESNATPPVSVKKVVEVPAGGVAKLEIKLS